MEISYPWRTMTIQTTMMTSGLDTDVELDFELKARYYLRRENEGSYWVFVDLPLALLCLHTILRRLAWPTGCAGLESKRPRALCHWSSNHWLDGKHASIRVPNEPRNFSHDQSPKQFYLHDDRTIIFPKVFRSQFFSPVSRILRHISYLGIRVSSWGYISDLILGWRWIGHISP